ncbi:MAG: P1 family peptidase [Coriobacteriaceae bacterium]|nr:P1 family peptidase [Coriobacteriaceae bacterium]
MKFEEAVLGSLPAFRFGHATDTQAGTGCSVVLAPAGAVCGASVSGGGPATRETDLLRPENMIEAVHALVLAGGSAFGLEASSGVMDALAKRSLGFPLAGAYVPIVCGACIFDLAVGHAKHPDKAMGRKAAEAALDHVAFEEGNVGVGAGASVGKLLGPGNAMKSGFGIRVLRCGELVVGALAVVNALGNVKAPDGAWLAGCRGDDGNIVDPLDAFWLYAQSSGRGPQGASLDTGFETSAAFVAGPSETTALQASDTSQAVASLQASDTSQAAASPQASVMSQDAASPQASVMSQAAAPQSPLHPQAPANTTLGIVVTNASLTKAQATRVSAVVNDAYARAIKPVHTSHDGDAVFTFASGPVDALPDWVAVMATEAMEAAIRRAAQVPGAFGLPGAADKR